VSRTPADRERRLDMGASRYVSLYRTRIAHVLVAQGRDEDALAELEQARHIYGEAPSWKAARARALARRGRRRSQSRSPAKQATP
jgi:hypothetical protein